MFVFSHRKVVLSKEKQQQYNYSEHKTGSSLMSYLMLCYLTFLVHSTAICFLFSHCQFLIFYLFANIRCFNFFLLLIASATVFFNLLYPYCQHQSVPSNI